MTDLRDHSQPCEHEDDARLWNIYGGTDHWDCRQGGCPGGREVTDAELAARLVSHGWTVSVTAPAKTAATGGNVDAPAI